MGKDHFSEQKHQSLQASQRRSAADYVSGLDNAKGLQPPPVQLSANGNMNTPSLWEGIKDMYRRIPKAIPRIPKATSKPQDLGSMPVGDGLVTPYGYGNVEKNSRGTPVGVTGGGGLGGIKLGGIAESLFSGDFHAGATPDEAGGTRYGYGVSWGDAKGKFNLAQLVDDVLGEGTVPKSLTAKGDVGIGTASVENWINPDRGFSSGAQANTMEGSGTFSSQGTGDRDASVRLGLSAGSGGAVRGHWADDDGDGNREYGFGLDAGPFSIDMKSEDPVRDFSGPLGMLAAHLVKPKGNLTNSAVGAAKSAWGSVTGMVEKASADPGKPWATGPQLLESVKGAWEGVKGLVNHPDDPAKPWATGPQSNPELLESVEGTWDSAKEKASDVLDGASSNIGETWDALKSLF